MSTKVLSLTKFPFITFVQRRGQISNPVISEANIFISGLAVPLTFKSVNGLVIEANFLANPLEKNNCYRGFNEALF